MDKKKILLLKYFMKNSGEGYFILDIAKIFSCIKKYKNNFDLLKKDVEYLKSLNYIDVKYLDKESVCLAIMDNSRILQENIKNESNIQKKFVFYMLIAAGLSGIMAFLGAFVANILL